MGHPLNLLLLGSAGASAILTGSLAPLLVGAAAELAWVVLGPRLPGQRRLAEGLRQLGSREAREQGEQALLREATEADRRRFLELDRLRRDIRESAAGARDVSGHLFGSELPKIDHLVESFLRISTQVARWESFDRETDLDALEGEVRRQRVLVEKAPDVEARALAGQNLELLERRLEQAAAVKRQIRHARGQLLLVENTLKLLRDQVVALQTPESLGERLDDLVRSVDAIEATTRETEAIASPLPRVGRSLAH